MSKIENVVKFMEQIAADNRHGYAQDNRNGSPDYDCSSFVGTALSKAGFKVNPASTTRNLYKQLIDCGFKELGISDSRKRGDIFLTPGKHVVVCTDANNIVHASLNEKGTIKNGRPGDQNGREICTRSFYNPSYKWVYHLRYVESPTKSTPTSTPVASTTIKGVDVSSCQGNVDWKKVKDSGIQFVILRSTLKNGHADPKFKENIKGCDDNKLDVSVYKYSYALTEEQSISEAINVISLLNGRKCKIWLDLEDKSQISLGKSGILKIANAFIKTCETHGHEVGIYCNLNWVKNYIDASLLKKHDLWIARYGANDGKINEKYKPNVNEKIWQYSSKGKVPGINGDVDLNIMYSTTSTIMKPTVKVDTTLNVRNKPNGNIVNKLKNSKEVDILDYKEGWFKIGESKWVNADYIDNSHGRVNTPILNIRSGASATYTDIGDLKENEIVRIFEEQKGWYKVLSSDQQFGWVSSQYIDLI
jgi:GH25 family lysozyme M1 (1,4-beta-N-acetylmuramidase)